MTTSHDKAAAAQRQLDRLSPANRAWAERYAKIRRLQGISESSILNYAVVLRQLDEACDGRPFSEVTPDQVLQMLTDLNQKVSTATIVSKIRLLRVVFTALHHGALPGDFGSILTTRDPPPPDHANLVSEDDLKLLLAACHKLQRSQRVDRLSHNQAFILCLWDSGMRISELTSLRIRDVSFQNDEVVMKLDAAHPDLKSGARTIVVHQCGPALKAWLAAHPCPAPDRYIFISSRCPDGYTSTGKTDANRLLAKLAQIAGLYQGAAKQLSCHDFRHSSATRRRHWGEADLRLFHGWSRKSRMPSRYVHTHIDSVRARIRHDAGLDDIALPSREMDLGLKECPMCAEDVKAAAKKCKHCGEFLTDEIQRQPLR